MKQPSCHDMKLTLSFSLGRLLLTLAVLVTLTVWCVIYPSNWALEWLELEVIPFGFRIFLVTLAAANLAISYICEKYFFLHLAGWLASIFKNMKGRAQAGYAPLSKPHKKIYKRVMQEMGIVDL